MNEIKVQQPQDRNKFGHLRVDWRVASPDPATALRHQLIGPDICHQTDRKLKKAQILASTLLNSSNMCVAGCIVQSNSICEV